MSKIIQTAQQRANTLEALEAPLKFARFDTETGRFIRTRTTQGAHTKAGDYACFPGVNGYRTISIANKQYLAHRVAILVVTGRWPEGEVDHIDGNRSNNRLANLRVVSRSENAQNLRDGRSDNKNGLLGVSPSRGMWQSTIFVDGKKRFLGRHATPELAHAAYLAAKRDLHAGCTI